MHSQETSNTGCFEEWNQVTMEGCKWGPQSSIHSRLCGTPNSVQDPAIKRDPQASSWAWKKTQHYQPLHNSLLKILIIL